MPVILDIEQGKLDMGSRTFIDGNGREVSLTRAEAELLAALAASLGRVLSRDQLCHCVAGHGAEPEDRRVDMIVTRLRRKIEPNPKAPRFVLTVRGLGYKFAAQPRSVENGKSAPLIGLKQGTEAQAALLLGPEDAVSANAPAIALPQCNPERRQLTVLSCALIDAAPLAAPRDPEGLGQTVQHLRDSCATIITRWGGSVASSTGHEIVASFGYPKAHEDDAERAVRAAFDLVATVGALPSPSGEPLQARIGIATGLVVVNEDRSVVGEAVIMAAQLRTTMPANCITVTASTRKLLSSVFVCGKPELRDLDEVSAPVTIYRVTGQRRIVSRFLAGHAGNLTKLVGRQHELQRLSALWKRTKKGEGQAALLCGEAGIGKSRVCEAFLGQITKEPRFIIRYQCSPHHTNSPFHPVINRLESVAGFEREDAPDAKLRKLQAFLAQAGAATVGDALLYAALLSIPTGSVQSDLTPQRLRDLTIAALIRQTLALAHQRPVIIVLEDAHWIDPGTLELISRLIPATKTASVLLLASFRPDFFPRWLDQSHVTMLSLNRLASEQTEAIIFDVAGRKELPHAVRGEIIDKADGVPLFAEELTKAVWNPARLKTRAIATSRLARCRLPAARIRFRARCWAR
jgi:class 3 adenylate cyclase